MSKSGKVTTITIVDAAGTHTATINDGADGSGTGDMLKATYDVDGDGVVDDSEKLGGQLPEHYASVDDLAEKASLPVSDTPPEDSEFWVDTGVSPTMLRRWRGADGVPTAREYQETHVGHGKNIADVVLPYQVASEPPASVISTITPGSIEMSASGAISSAWAAWRIWWPVKPGKNYTISVKMECDDDSYTPSLGVYTKTGINGAAQSRTALTSNGSVTINANDNDFIGLYLHFTTDTGTSGARTVRYYDIQIEEGGTATAYEPYHDIPFLALDNAQGQIESVALEMGCVANQAGTGDPSPENIRAISGHESVDVRACGKNLYDVNDRKTFSDGVTVDADGWVTVTADNSAGSSTIFKNCFTNPSLALRPSTQYAVVCEIVQINVTGQLTFSIVDLYNDPQALSQFAQAFSMTVNESTQTGTRIQVLTSRADLSDASSMLRTYVAFIPGASGTIKFRLAVLEDTSITAETFVYEPYRSMGGGTVTPTEPLYGLPGAEDTVEISTDGDVLGDAADGHICNHWGGGLDRGNIGCKRILFRLYKHRRRYYSAGFDTRNLFAL